MKKRTLICIIIAVCLLIAAGVAAAVVLSRRPQTSPDTPPQDTETAEDSFDIRNNVLYSYVGKNKEVRIPDGVTSIESGAFDSCDTLTDIYLPESLQSVAEGALPAAPEEYRLHFSNNRLEGLTPEIRAKGMENCIVVIPGEEFIWPEDLLSLRYVKGFEVSGEQKYFAAKDGVLYYGDMSALYLYPAYKDTKEFVIPDETEYIYSKAFSSNEHLENLIMSDNIYMIEDEAIKYLPNLKSVTLSASLTSVGGENFQNCPSLESVTVKKEVAVFKGNAFEGCESLTNITFEAPEKAIIREYALWRTPWYFENFGYYNIKEINGKLHMLDYAGDLTNVVIPEGVVAAYWKTPEDETPESITIPASLSVEKIFDYHRFGLMLPRPEQLIIAEDHPDLIAVDGAVYSRDMKILYFVPPAKCANGTFVIPETVEEIAIEAFYHCSDLQSIRIPSNVREIRRAAFAGCTSLAQIEFEEGLQIIGDSAFAGCKCEEVELPESLTTLGSHVFGHTLRRVKLPAALTIIRSSFDGCSPDIEFDIPEELSVNNCEFVIEDGVLVYMSDFKGPGYHVEVPEGVTEIGSQAFDEDQGYGLLLSVKIPEGVKKIDDFAFVGCYHLKSVTLPETLEEIGDHAFSGCENLSDITLPSSLKTIGKNAFYNTPLTKSIVPSTVESVARDAFDKAPPIVVESDTSEASDK